MKVYIPTSWGWYIAVVVIFGPMVLIWTMEPNWVARVIGVLGYAIVLPIVGSYALFSKENQIVNAGAWLYKKFDKRKVDLVSHIIIIFFGVFYIYNVSVPFIKDLVLIHQNLAPIERTAYVAHTRSLSGNISEEVILDTYPMPMKADDLTAWYFSPRHIMTGNTYRFLYIPNSRIILEAIPVEIINQ